MSSSEASSTASSTSSKPRIRIPVPSTVKLVQSTPVRDDSDERHHEVSPTPIRGSNAPTHCKPAAILPSQNNNDGSHLPELSPKVLNGLRSGGLEYPINEECTSLKITPSGRLVVAGFTDGTLRLFDLFSPPEASHQQSQSSASEDELTFEAPSKTAMVCSKAFQHYGAVACQIHARGVHTSLLMHVDCSEDGLYSFGGVIRGSMELVAVDLSHVGGSQSTDLLDLIRVYRHSDAKLKGFGACTRLKGPTQKYLLLTGKGIKNIHIWSFEPLATNQWQCLYDTQTNGNTISILHLRYDPQGLLQALSKSDSQKLRVWDLSYEQHGGDPTHALYHKQSTIQQLVRKMPASKERPKRPPYADVASTESTLGIAGAFSFGGSYNQVSVVSLDVENVGSPYNHTEMALPGCGTNRRQQRGDLQSIQRVAGMTKDASHVLLELSNGSVVHYLSDPQRSASRLEALASFQSDDGSSRNLCVEKIGAQGLVVAAMSAYYASSGRGSIVLHALDTNHTVLSPVADKQALAAATVSAEAPSPNQSIQLFGTTPKEAKTKKSKKHRAVVDAPKVTTQPEVARISLDSNAEIGSLMQTPEGVAVSPEQGLELSSAPKQNVKKVGAMLKYLKTSDAVTKTTTIRTPAVSRRLHHESGSAAKAKQANRSGAKVSASKRPRSKTPPKTKLLNIAEERSHQKMKDTPSNRSGKALEKGEEKRVKSPCVPRKHQHVPSGNFKPVSQPSPEADSLLEVAETLCDIRRGTPSPKRTRPNTGTYGYITQRTPIRQTEQRPRHPHRQRPATELATQLPKTSVMERIGTQDNVAADISSQQEAARMQLAAEHRAGHEMLRKRVLSTVDRIARSLSHPQTIADNEARTCLNEEMYDLKKLLENMLNRQRMEASALAAEQSLQRNGQTVPELQVSFPFPKLFDTANDAFERFMSEEKISV